MSEDLSKIPCARCGGTMEQAINAEQNTRRAWLCRVCGYIQAAIGRERVVGKDNARRL